MASQQSRSAPSHFPLFSDLPPELRIQVWQSALPDELGPALYAYRTGCWWPRHLTAADAGYEPADASDNLVLEFRHSMLGVARIDLPFAAISDETREAARRWAAWLGVEVRPGAERAATPASTLFVRPFAPALDTLYVPADAWDDVVREPMERPWELGEMQDRAYCVRSEVYRIAVPAALLVARHRDATFHLKDLFEGFPFLRALYVVMDPQPDLTPSPRSELPWQSQIDETRRDWKMVWDDRGKEWQVVWDNLDARSPDNGALRERLVDAGKQLQEGFLGGNHGVEIRAVSLKAPREGRDSDE